MENSKDKIMENIETKPSEFEIDCFIIRALKSGEMHNWFVCKNVFKKTEKELEERYNFIKAQGIEYRNKIDQFNKEIEDSSLRKMKVAVYLAEHDPVFESWSETKKICCYSSHKLRLEKLGLYPVTESEYEKIRFV